MQKLLFVKWISLLMSVGFIAFFIVSDIYQDNEEYKIPIIVQEEIEEIAEEVIDPIESVNIATPETIDESSLITCNDFINAYNAQVASDNDKISKVIVEKYNECMGIETAETTATTKPEKEEKTANANSKKNK